MKYAVLAASAAAAAAILFAAPAAADADGAPAKNDRGTAQHKPRAQRPPQPPADFDLGKAIFNAMYPPRPARPAPVMPELGPNAPIWAKQLRVAINDFVYYHPAPNQPWIPR